MSRKIHPALAEHAMEENEKLREILSEIRRHNSSGLTKAMQGRIDAAISQQAEPECSVCSGDCAAANPPVMNCPQREPAPAQDEREQFKRALHSQRLFKLSSATIDAAEWAWFARPAQTEQQPVCWASSASLAKLRNGRNNSPCVLTDGPAEFNDTPLYAAPIAQTAPQPEQSELVEALEAIVRQYPNPDISHVDYRVHACKQAEHALANYRAALAQPAKDSPI